MEQTMQISKNITRLVTYAIRHSLIAEEDRAYAINALLTYMKGDAYEEVAVTEAECEDLEDILRAIDDDAASRGLLEYDSVTYRDLYDTGAMGLLTDRPSNVIRRFYDLYKEAPEKATDYFYALAKDSDYIRTYRVKKDQKWSVDSPYGEIDITINLSKPEKDPRAIAAARTQAATSYPACLLCHANEGFAGNATKPPRQNLRQIPLTMANTRWYLQYSPYVYYNEHCIALSSRHEPMRIDDSTFVKLLDFVETFPHYFLGSNADLPIVGGSILSHDHMQGGHYTFAMERAAIEIPVSFADFPQVTAGIVRWPMSVLRLTSADRHALETLASRVLSAWRGYTDESAMILAETNGEAHNTITPIARRRGADYELDLVLRNNLTTEAHPMGLYHPHAEYHNIKKENIGLIEVMGLAVLPARLKNEMQKVKELLLAGKELASDPDTEKHAAWAEAFRGKYTFTEENAMDILQKEIGATFVHVLENAGVYACTEEGRAAFLRFLAAVGGHPVFCG